MIAGMPVKNAQKKRADPSIRLAIALPLVDRRPRLRTATNSSARERHQLGDDQFPPAVGTLREPPGVLVAGLELLPALTRHQDGHGFDSK